MGSWLIDGKTRLIDVERKIGATGFVHADYSTLAGLVLHRLGRLPRVGESLTYNGFRLEVVDLDGRRIDKVMVDRVGGEERKAAGEKMSGEKARKSEWPSPQPLPRGARGFVANSVRTPLPTIVGRGSG